MAGPDDHGPDPGASDAGALAKLQEEVAETQLPDPILRVLVSVCNRGTFSFAITIAQGGLVITGTAVGVGRFMHDLAAEIEQRGGSDAAVLSEPLRYLATIADEPEPTDDPTEDLPVYLHLEHARVRSANSIIAEDVRWRARLTSVDGWSLGAHA
jgi:hypothetical protein